MKTLLLALVACCSVAAQTTTQDKFTGIEYTYSKEVEVYRNRGGFVGALVYSPDAVRMRSGYVKTKNTAVLSFSVDSIDWQFIGDCSINVLADGERQSLKCAVQSSRAFTLQHDVYVNEVLSVTLSPEEFTKLLSSKSLEMRVGIYEFKFKEKHLKELLKVVPASTPPKQP